MIFDNRKHQPSPLRHINNTTGRAVTLRLRQSWLLALQSTLRRECVAVHDTRGNWRGRRSKWWIYHSGGVLPAYHGPNGLREERAAGEIGALVKSIKGGKSHNNDGRRL